MDSLVEVETAVCAVKQVQTSVQKAILQRLVLRGNVASIIFTQIAAILLIRCAKVRVWFNYYAVGRKHYSSGLQNYAPMYLQGLRFWLQCGEYRTRTAYCTKRAVLYCTLDMILCANGSVISAERVFLQQ
jgi:hypothetical protein